MAPPGRMPRTDQNSPGMYIVGAVPEPASILLMLLRRCIMGALAARLPANPQPRRAMDALASIRPLERLSKKTALPKLPLGSARDLREVALRPGRRWAIDQLCSRRRSVTFASKAACREVQLRHEVKKLNFPLQHGKKIIAVFGAVEFPPKFARQWISFITKRLIRVRFPPQVVYPIHLSHTGCSGLGTAHPLFGPEHRVTWEGGEWLYPVLGRTVVPDFQISHHPGRAGPTGLSYFIDNRFPDVGQL